VRKLIYTAPGTSALSRVFSRLNCRKPIVLALHGVTSEAPGHLCNHQGKHLYLPVFAGMMEHVRDAYTPVPLSRIVEWLEGRAEPTERAVAVTFDDGYRDVLTNAVPVLSRLGIPATVYVVTDFVKEGKMVWTDRIVSALSATKKARVTVASNGRSVELSLRDDREKAAADEKIRSLCKALPDGERTRLLEHVLEDLAVGDSEIVSAWPDHAPLSPDDLKTLVGAGVDIGSHTKSHRILTRCDTHDVRRELEESKRFIESITGMVCDGFSYPNGRPGDFDQRTRACVREAGYRSAATSIATRVSRRDDPFEIPRYTLGHNEMTNVEFAAELSGYVSFLRQMKRKTLG
jgi:peptidoglycan/xylan/chitin deacetylase (PgdA/CDA1 family)